MRKEVVNKKTEHLFKKIIVSDLCKNFYLAGGTALALQFEHRKSIDLDLFSFKDFDTIELRNGIKTFGKLLVESEEKNTLNTTIDKIKVSFLGYKYKLIFPVVIWEGARIADWRDIACMKLDAASSRGSKKDFIDLYFILQKISLKELFKLFDKKYKDIEYSKLHMLKSLIYFTDADEEPMPIMLKDIKWREVKAFFEKEISRITKEIIGLE